MPKRRFSYLLAIAVAVVIACAILSQTVFEHGASGPFSARVLRAVDGDTLVVQPLLGSPERIRVIGVDTPEDVAPGRPVQCWSRRAAAFTQHALEGREVVLVPGRERHDRYGRTLAYVTRSDGFVLEDALLRGGFARTLAIAPNIDHATHYSALELSARRAGRGLWGACPGALAWAASR
jgi:micrococcal nuclease